MKDKLYTLGSVPLFEQPLLRTRFVEFLIWTVCLVLPKSVKKWSLRTLREKLIKIGAKVVRHSWYVVFQMAEVVVPKALFGEILDRIGRLRASLGLVGAG